MLHNPRSLPTLQALEDKITSLLIATSTRLVVLVGLASLSV